MTIAALTRRGIPFRKNSHSRPFLVFGISGSHSPEAPPVPSQAQMILHKAIHRSRALTSFRREQYSRPPLPKSRTLKNANAGVILPVLGAKLSRLLPLISTIFPRRKRNPGKRWSLPRPETGMIKIFFPAGDTCRQSGSVPLLRRQAQPKKYRENILNGFRLFKEFQRVLEKQEHSGRTILRNAKRFNKPDTVHKHAQPIPVRPQTPGPRIRLPSCKERYMPFRVVLVLI